MFRKLIGALFGLSMVQSQDTLQNKSDVDVVVEEQIVEIVEQEDGHQRQVILEQEIDEDLLNEEMTLIRPTDMSSRVESMHKCQECPLHCFSKAEANYLREGPSHKKESWVSQKADHLKRELANLKNKISNEMDVLKDKINKFLKKNEIKDKDGQDHRRNSFRSR
ncbi:hypothetical protein [Candidatus Similichlamydia epinepheli]|uniref:hypothetical protein n=1 Tax=Candidatus Similichlamydia epinepheli TaxID=1903953 RepID=UPI000D3D30DD|nr:hypothetical protein [Candidatus Similichlamydia epinepheli]